MIPRTRAAAVFAFVALLGCTPLLGEDWDRPLRAASPAPESSVDEAGACDGGPCPVTCAPPLERCGARCCGPDMLAMGIDHTCAITATGGVKCWGGNTYGQLGDDSTEEKLRPVDVVGLDEPVVQLTAGASFTCANTASGVLKCWGSNFSGELGNGSLPARQKPVDVRGLPAPVSMISAGRDHACAVLSSGALYCWGNNTEGQLGDGTFYSAKEPVLVQRISSRVIGVAAAGEHTCALVEDGKVLCWGDNLLLQLGVVGPEGTESPVSLPSLPKAVALSAGFQHTCALLEDRSVRCWGRGTEGQLGGPDPDTSAVPVNAIALTSARAIRSGNIHSCALLADGAVKCWGDNSKDQLGAGESVFDVRDRAVAIGAGGYHACAWLTSGALMCWGNNAYGQLGIGTRVGGPPQEPVEGL